MRLRLYWSYASRALARGGQRTLLALFCIAVGVMAIVALQLVGLSINDALTSNIVEANGGDLRVDTILVPFTQKDLGYFTGLRQAKTIKDYASTYEIPGSVTLPNGTIEPFDVEAVSPNFPLLGQANFTQPRHDLRIQDIVQGTQVAINSTVADALGAHLGSSYIVKTSDGRTLSLTVGAIFFDGGAFHGPQLIVSAATLDAATGPSGAASPPQFTTVTITTPAATLNAVKATIRQQFGTANVTTATDELKLREQDVADIRLFLQIVALLALFIGGIGIINTMQVLLRRRRTEIAVLKTMGYRQRDLYALFGVEAALLGALGSMLGVAFGLGASYAMRSIVERAFFLHLTITPDPGTLLGGVLVGIATALIFGLLPIVQAARVRPLAVLRDDVGYGSGSWLLTGGLLLLLSLLFVGLATVIMGNVVIAVAAIYGGAIVVLLLAGFFSLLVLLIAKLPVYERPQLRMGLWIGGGALVFAAAYALLVAVRSALQHLDLLAPTGLQVARSAAPVLAAGAVGLLVAGGALVFLLAALADGAIMFAPRGWKTAVQFAFRNIGRQRSRATTTLTALFVGVFGIGVILLLGQGIKDAINTTFGTLFAHNLFIVAPPSAAPTIDEALAGISGIHVDQTTANLIGRTKPISIAGRDIASVLDATAQGTSGDQSTARRAAILLTLSVIEGYDLRNSTAKELPHITMTDGRNLSSADAGTDAVVLNDLLERPPASLHVGDAIVEQSADGSVTRTLHIIGFFNRVRTTDFIPGEVLLDAPQALALGGPLTLDLVSLKVDLPQVPAIKTAIAHNVPFAQVVSLTDLNAIIDRVLNNLIVMLTAIASLAMLAGLIIIANAVALAMVERRREIGILKSVGHTSRSILAMVLIENGLIGLLGSLMAVLLVIGLIIALSAFVFKVDIAIAPAIVAGIIGVTALLTMLVAALVAWGATRVRPLEVLRYE